MKIIDLKPKSGLPTSPYFLPENLRREKGHLRLHIACKIVDGPVALLASGKKGDIIFEKWIKTGEEHFSLNVPHAEKARIISFRFESRNEKRELNENQILAFSIELLRDEATKTLKDITREFFTTRADRSKKPKIASINTTEVCNLTCVMCHFNGPNAIKKSGTLQPPQVLKALDQIPKGEEVWFCATGEFFIDQNALLYLRAAKERELQPKVLTNGQAFSDGMLDEVLRAGVRLIRMSVDSTDPKTYRQIRRGGELANIVRVCEYLKQKKKEKYPDLRVEINATLFSSTFKKQEEMENFWRPLVDQVAFNAEYHHTFEFRNLFRQPEIREDCDIQMYVMPSGYIAPCCAIAVYQHENDVSWLPHIDQMESMEETHKKLCDLYEDKNGPMGQICSKCDWWILSMKEPSAYSRVVPLGETCSRNLLRKWISLLKLPQKKV